VDVTKPALPQRLGSQNTGSYAAALQLDGTRAYVADVQAGLKIYDTTAGTNTVELGGFDTPGECRDIAVNGNLVCLVDGTVHFLNVSDPSHPIHLSVYGNGYATAVKMAGTNAYVGFDAEGVLLTVLDISNPATPRVLGSYSGTGGVRSLTIASNQVFLAKGWGGGFEIVNVSDPQRLFRTSGFDSGDTWQLDVEGTRAYVADGIYGLKIFDISDPAHPKLLGNCETEGRAFGICVKGELAYIADDERGLQVFYIGDPQRPLRIGGNPLFKALRVDALDNRLYVAGMSDGLVILDQPEWVHIQSGLPTPGWIHFWLTGTTGLTSTIQRSTDLLHWEDWVSVPLDIKPTEISDACLVTNRFYRAAVRQQPGVNLRAKRW